MRRKLFLAKFWEEGMLERLDKTDRLDARYWVLDRVGSKGLMGSICLKGWGDSVPIKGIKLLNLWNLLNLGNLLNLLNLGNLLNIKTKKSCPG